MKSLRGLRWALEPARSRYFPIYIAPGARVSFSTRTSSKIPRNDSGQADERHSDPSKSTQHALSQPMRAMMRQLPHPVVVITTLENTRQLSDFKDILDTQPPPPIPRAMTVSSLTSLSIDPVPRVTFNVTLPSTTYEALVHCGHFNAHILTGNEHGARIADLFTRGNRSSIGTSLGVLAGLEELGVQILGQKQWQQEWEQAVKHGGNVPVGSKAEASINDDKLPWSGTLPVLQGEGVMYVLKCEYRKLTPPIESDFDHHAIVMGEVKDILLGNSEVDGAIALAYADRAYRRMGEKLLERPTSEQAVSSEGNSPQPVNRPSPNLKT
ncbi:flavin reductase like domain-containing protein [Hypoxylon sp. NC1633]|nr:flavin reductase like domain-containing protein [Hypoxylon sp. NC1633]